MDHQFGVRNAIHSDNIKSIFFAVVIVYGEKMECKPYITPFLQNRRIT